MIRVKICGVTTPEDALAAAEAGADYLGLNFYSRSPRFLTVERAKEILSVLPPSIRAVGLFVDTLWSEVAHIVGNLGSEVGPACRAGQCRSASGTYLNLVQTYSDQLPSRDEFDVDYIPTFRIKDRYFIDSIYESLRTVERKPHAIIVDAYDPNAIGGTGRVAPWELLEGFSPGMPWFLAGGLTPENVAEAVKRLRPDGVDVSSGVESSPGRKDPFRMRRFVEAARGT